MLQELIKVNINKKVFVLGMARSGYESAKLLINEGYDVVINDSSTNQDSNHIKELESLGVKIILGSHPEDLFDNTFDMIVKNPGISNNHKYIEKANRLNIRVINELELAYRYFPSDITIVGVTGTNGKTTTTTIIYEILKEASKSVFLMGNIGYPACSFIKKLKSNDILVIEVSDHQLCNVVDFKTNISVLTNISEAHLDFHGSYEAYKNTKKRIFNHHTTNDIAILNLNNSESLSLTEDIKSTKKFFSTTSSHKDLCLIIDDSIYYNNEKIISLDDLKLKGSHNHENVMAAISVVKELNVGNKAIVNVLKTFGGVEHRMEYFKTINNVDFYNDSKATNIKSTQTALSSFSRPTILLLGGLDRGISFDDLKEYTNNVKLIIAFGEVKLKVKEFADKYNLPCKVANSLKEASNIAYSSSKDGDVVLFSPACAAWDEFKDFEVRGRLFKECINNLDSN